MGNTTRYIAAILVIVFFAVFSTVFIAGRNARKATEVKSQPSVVKVSDYANKDSSSVVWTQAGRLLGDDRRRTVRITVSSSERKVELLDGYTETVSKTAVFSNNKTAYTDFLLALENVHFGQDRKVKQTDERGVCPLGSRYIYELKDGNDQKLRLWSDSCLTADGTFAGNAGTVRDLFKAQITGYDKFISGVQF